MENITVETTNEEINELRNHDYDNVKQQIMYLVKNKYEIQKLRIGCGNRIVAAIRVQLGQEPSSPEEEMPDESLKLIKAIQKEYKRISDACIENMTTIKKQINELSGEMHYIKTLGNFNLVDSYMSLVECEEKNKSSLKEIVHQHPMWDAFFKDILGCGEETAGVCIALFDPYKARHASSFLKYAGLNPVKREDKNGNVIVTGNSKAYTEEFEYVDAEGNIKTKRGITYNPNLKTALLGVSATCFLKSGLRSEKDADGNPTGFKVAKGIYVNAYCDYKCRQLELHKDFTKMHIERMSLRYMMRLFVRDMWVKWRQIEGLPVTLPYEVEFLGRAPHKFPNLCKYSFPESNTSKK